MCFFFFKQKTAYEMRISDWSSDVCSSDLLGDDDRGVRVDGTCAPSPGAATRQPASIRPPLTAQARAFGAASNSVASVPVIHTCPPPAASLSNRRSEEHTSELQSLMRISYAVFCLKKKTQ